MPALERILCRITQLPKGGSNAFPELYIEFDCSNAVFVRVRELPPSSPRIPPHPHPADPILTQGVLPIFESATVDKFTQWLVLTFLSLSLMARRGSSEGRSP
jgi:hypothetical protein